jgi:cyclic pyranopterin phosphate synthase
VVRDRLQRPLRDLRVSVTDRCNLRCRYCMPREVFGADFAFLPREELLSFEEIARLATVMAGLGVSKVRLTGGEPLLRHDLPRLVEMLAGIEGVTDLALTTNGLLLARHAEELRGAGLLRVTVSLDALEEDDLRAISDAAVSPALILEGIEAASAAGLDPVKVNMVVRRGQNDHCLEEMAEHFRHGRQILRFIEYMDVGSSNGWRAQDVVPAGEILARIHARWPLEPISRASAGEVASRYRYRDGAGEIGLIHSVSGPFCGACTRARLSADGKLYTCLFANRGHDLRGLLRGGAGDADLEAELREIWGNRTDRYSAERAAADRDRSGPARVEMSYIGG